MKRFLSLLLAFLISISTLTACTPGNGTGQSQPGNSIEASFDLKDLDNPFIGQWQTFIPSAGMTVYFDFKADASFTYEMLGVPDDQGGVGAGYYMVYDNVMVTYLDFEGAAAYTFAVIDNNTIDVTELEPNATGALVAGLTAPFVRIEGSEIITTNTGFTLDNLLIGKWQSEGTDEPTSRFSFNTDGTWSFEQDDVPADYAQGSGCYMLAGDLLVTYLVLDGASYLQSYQLHVIDSRTIDVTQIYMDENGVMVFGETIRFVAM